MTDKLNCWQYKNCGREAGGMASEVLGVCPVTMSHQLDGVNDGIAGGRCCWKVSKSRISGDDTRCCALMCHTCGFYRRVMFEEADSMECQFVSVSP